MKTPYSWVIIPYRAILERDFSPPATSHNRAPKGAALPLSPGGARQAAALSSISLSPFYCCAPRQQAAGEHGLRAQPKAPTQGAQHTAQRHDGQRDPPNMAAAPSLPPCPAAAPWSGRRGRGHSGCGRGVGVAVPRGRGFDPRWRCRRVAGSIPAPRCWCRRGAVHPRNCPELCFKPQIQPAAP